jgi:hypothetical protein
MSCLSSGMNRNQTILKLVDKAAPRVTPKPVLKPRPTLPKQSRFESPVWEEYRANYSGLD